ncbi:MAG: metallophosphoesterase [bacterium]|nr:metallophosphoesterase [bacterium]
MKIKKIGMFLGVVTILFLLLYIYGFYIEPNMIIEKECTLTTTEKETKEEIKIIQLSDIELSSNFSLDKLLEVVNKVNAQKPDIVVFTGDLFQDFSKYNEMDEVIQKLSSIQSRYGKYAVYGNKDYGGGAGSYYDEIMKEAGFRVLVNEDAEIDTENGQKILIAGVDDELWGNPDIEQTSTHVKDKYDYRILLAHEPSLGKKFVEEPFDVILTGHSHGKQVNIPLISKLVMKDHVGDGEMRSGFYEFNDTKLYVNTGLGTSQISVRIFVPPEIVIFNLKL